MMKNAHLIGLCGAGMSAVARLLQETGYIVTGSDEGFYPPVSDYLTRIGLGCMIGHRASNIPPDPDLIVIGKHAKLVPESNEEVAAALDQYADNVHSFPQVLAQLTADRERMVVAGSYGKSTLTSLITWCLVSTGKAPGWFIGAIPKGLSHSSAMGGAGPFIFEGDEYPSANWDDRPKFVHYDPATVLLTSATHDHVNIYPTLQSYHAPFHALMTGLSERQGHLIACTDEQYSSNFFYAFPGRKTSYGLEPGADYGAQMIELGDPIAGTPTRFTLTVDRTPYPGFETSQMGRHAVQNICGAAAYLVGEGHLTIDEFQAAVAAFAGLERRLDRKAPGSALPVYEGFGSSYEKARAAIDAMRAHFPQRRLIVMFEPHTFTWRNRNALSQYDSAFAGTDTVWMFAPPDHGQGTHDQVSGEEIVERARQTHRDVRIFTKDDVSQVLDDASPSNDVLLILSSGSFGGSLARFLAAVVDRHPATS
ncbi:UDP-N-acetylmuramate--L-alanine ligase [Parvularcula sp. LCG005]|uniref:UDP-N-acetylmuramate--L-alanine ligase n=1 Tax=Parvularcula sp. LCG005 TaxID=3078805 RepID=UPI00294233FA|nr:Mur ligase domain-containing protein [Parvularcula sp. LCG005]WOI52132.1 Mur ligase domain-containing protein [Parvularcula sp. LCG005]